MPTFRAGILYPLLLLQMLAGLSARGEEELRAPDPEPAKYGKVFVIPIHDMIEPALLYIIRRGVREANAFGAEAIVFSMDTPGGRVDTTEEIIRVIEAVKVPTYTLVEHNAISAGAIISLATDHIYMMPGSKIGDAMPIMASPQGGMQQLGEAEREKIESYVDSLVRGLAQRKGRDETMASAMVRRSIEFKIGDEVISPEGQILTLTHLEAERVFEIDGVSRPLLSEGTVESEEAFFAMIATPEAEIRRIEPTEFEQVARFIAMLAPILLTLGMLAIWIEFQTPGIGWAGMIGAVCLGLFFFGHHIAGLSGQEDILLFMVGIALILVEIFVLPGFGVAGLLGILIVLYSLLSAMTPSLPDGTWMPDVSAMGGPAKRLAVSMLMTLGGMLVAGKFMPKSRAFRWLVLDAATSRETGYAASDSKPDLVGQTGRTVNALRPGGTAIIGEERYDVVSSGLFIEAGKAVRVVEVHGSRIVVEPAEETA